MKRSSLEGDYGLDQSLKRLEHDVEWNQDRADLVRERIGADMYKIKKKRRTAKVLLIAATLFFLMGTPILLQDHWRSLTEDSPAIEKETIFPTEEPITAKQQDNVILLDPEYQFFPLNAQEYVEGISGEPTITRASYAKYPYQLNESLSDFLHILIEPNELSQEEMYKQLTVDLNYHSSVPYESEELVAGGHPAFLEVSGQEMGGMNLRVVTEDFLYLFTTPKSFQPKDMTKEEIEQLKVDMIELANLFQFK
ncbi:hypothetical protein FZC76_13730 [Sutcliffiella horikoshii]|uniref:DUF4367 domain-containing protein n=1 Tax=Sutcliffiella horikoshii TaxID=79883 RepID=A0A5D4SW79_9BACI|nr:hypothetical protein [Sutcliffiella horikoshii]TYS67630.1 hypothetical protein FZC76_13730 [Sutcliffiella horikoshii]